MKKQITLDCGVAAETLIFDNREFIKVSLESLYGGWADLGDMAKLFNELAEKGYSNLGISLEPGYCDPADDLILTVARPVTTKGK